MKQQAQTPDYSLLFVTLILTCFGICMVFSASMVVAQKIHNDGYFFLKRQIIYSIIGIIMVLIFSNIDYNKLRVIVPYLLLVNIILLLAVFSPSIGVGVRDVKRWIDLKFFWFQPSELAKLTLILFLAASLPKRIERLRRNFLSNVSPYLLVLAIFSLLIIKQPAISTCIIIILLFFLMLFAAGVKLHHLLIIGLIGMLLMSGVIKKKPYGYQRIIAFTNKTDDIRKSDYQSYQSLLAIAEGGLTGTGIGESKQKFLYLPHPHTDFIFAIIAEEAGYIGCVVVVGLFLFLIIKGYRIALLCEDNYGKLLSFGITTHIAIQLLLHIGVVSGILPVTGVTLPLLSYGGSSLILTLTSIGILLNISYNISLKTTRMTSL